MSSDELFSEALEAARAGDRDTARDKLERLLEEDEENIKAWLLLARLSDTYEEKRICLTTVLQLDPGNKRAEDMLEKLEERIAERDVDEVIPGVSRRQATVIGGGIAAILVVGLIVVIMIVSSSNQRDEEQNVEQTSVARTAIAIPTLQAQSNANSTLTQIAIISPTPTITNTSVIPPTATPTPTATDIPAIPPPSGIPGTLLGWSGFDGLNIGYLPLVSYPLASGGAPVPIGDNILGRYVTSSDGVRLIFAGFRQGLPDAERISEIDLSQAADEIAISNLGFLWTYDEILEEPDEVDVSPDGSFIVFTAESFTTGSREVFLFNLPGAFVDTEDAETEGGEVAPVSTELIRLTNDSANYAYPVVSADGLSVAVVRTLTEGGNPGTDIVSIEIASRTQLEITQDRDVVTEAMLRWHPNGQEIIYAYTTAENDNHAIGSVAGDGSGLSYDITNNPDEDQIFPVMSPDGRYVAYTSNRLEIRQYDLFIYDTQSTELFQLTSDRNPDYASDWLP